MFSEDDSDEAGGPVGDETQEVDERVVEAMSADDGEGDDSIQHHSISMSRIRGWNSHPHRNRQHREHVSRHMRTKRRKHLETEAETVHRHRDVRRHA